jgi:hypothetical protein
MDSMKKAFNGREATMCMLKLRLVLMLFALIGLPVVLVAGEAYATGCCMCTSGCSRSCYCPGTHGCLTCAIEDFETVQSNSAAIDTPSGITVVRKPATSIATNSHMLDRLIRLGQTGQCALNNFRLRLMADGQKLLKLDQMFLKAYASQDNTVALRITEQYSQ